MALINYEKGVLFLGGACQVQVTSIKLSHDPKRQPVETMQGGLSGFSPGAESTTWDVEGVVPRSGFEFDYLAKLQSGEIVECTLWAHGKKTTAKGVFMKLDQSYGVNDMAKVSFQVMTTPADETTI